MLMELTFTSNINLKKSQLRKIVRSIIRRTTPFVSKNFAKLITEGTVGDTRLLTSKLWNIKLSDLRARLLKERSKFGAINSFLSDNVGKVTFKTISIPLIYFSPIIKTGINKPMIKVLSRGKGSSAGLYYKTIKRQYSGLARVKILKTKTTVFKKNVFLVKMKSGHVGLFMRMPVGGKKSKLVEKHVITPYSMVLSDDKRNFLIDAVYNKIQKEFQYAYDYHINNIGKK